MTNELITPEADLTGFDPAVAAAIREAETDRLVDDIKTGSPDAAGIITAERGEQGEAIVGRSSTDTTKSEAFVADPANADKIVVYDQVTGVPSTVLLSMLSFQLRKRVQAQPDIPTQFWGIRAFDRTPPPADRIAPRREMKCWLHPEHANRQVYDAIGLAGRMCRKWNIPTAMDVELHVRHKHPKEYEVIKNAVTEANTSADRAAARASSDAMVRLVEGLLGGEVELPSAEAAHVGDAPIPADAVEASAPAPPMPEKPVVDTAPATDEVAETSEE